MSTELIHDSSDGVPPPLTVANGASLRLCSC